MDDYFNWSELVGKTVASVEDVPNSMKLIRFTDGHGLTIDPHNSFDEEGNFLTARLAQDVSTTARS